MKIDIDDRNEQIRFLIAGTVVNATDYGIYFSLIHFLFFSLSKGISFTFAGIVGYVLNKYWTFKHRQPSYIEVGRYIVINVLALGINVLTNQGVLNVWPGAIWLALIVATVVTSVLTFMCFKWWVFKT